MYEQMIVSMYNFLSHLKSRSPQGPGFGEWGAGASKIAKNKMSFEIHVTTIATSSLSFGLKNRTVFWAVEFFRA